MKATRILLAAAVTLAIAGRGSAETLRVFAASSLAEPFTELGKRFSQAHPGNTVEFNFAGSQALRTQIEQGAPADVYASADLVQMQALQRDRMVEDYVVFARNSLAVVTPATGPRIRALSDLARPGVRLVLAGENVPAGRYADQVLRAMDASGRFGRDFRRRVLANVVSREPNVRSVLAKVTMGEADAGIVYVTDVATAIGKIKVLSIPARLNATATYPVAILTESKRKSLAADFIRLVRSAEGNSILARHGFRPQSSHG